MRKTDAGAGLILLAFASGYGYLTAQLPTRSLPNTPGPAFQPWLLTSALVALAVGLLVRALTQKGGGKESPSFPASAWLFPLLGVLTLALYIWVVQAVGYLLTTPFFIAALMVLAGSRRWLAVVLTALGATWAVYGVFQKAFQVILPPSPFGA